MIVLVTMCYAAHFEFIGKQDKAEEYQFALNAQNFAIDFLADPLQTLLTVRAHRARAFKVMPDGKHTTMLQRVHPTQTVLSYHTHDTTLPHTYNNVSHAQLQRPSDEEPALHGFLVRPQCVCIRFSTLKALMLKNMWACINDLGAWKNVAKFFAGSDVSTIICT